MNPGIHNILSPGLDEIIQPGTFRIGRFRRLILIVSILFLIGGTMISGQQNHFSVGAEAHYGFILAHSEAIERVSHSNPAGLTLNLNWLHTNQESWNVFRRYNISGIQAGWFDYRNPVVGRSYVLSVYTEPLIAFGDRFVFSIRAGGGLSWQTKIFDYVDDTISKFFSTRVSFPLHLSARLRYRLTTEVMLTFSGNYNHISNGAMRLPNYGINFPTVALGLEYFPGSFPVLGEGYPGSGHVRFDGRYVVFQGITGFKSLYGESFWPYGFSVRYTRHFRTWYSLSGGMEMIFDKGVRKKMEINGNDRDYKQLALTTGQDFYLGKVVFSQHLGIYIYSPYKGKDPVYQKYELLYRISETLRGGVFLKSHTSNAELFGFAVSYLLKL